MSLGNTVAESALYTCPTILHVSKNNPAGWLTFDTGHSRLQAFRKPSVKVKMRTNSVKHFPIIMAIYHTIVIPKGGPLNVSQSNLARGTVDCFLLRWPYNLSCIIGLAECALRTKLTLMLAALQSPVV